MAYLFDTDAISDLLRPRPTSTFVDWLASLDRDEQFTSAIVLGELYKGAFRSVNRDRHLTGIEQSILPRLTVLPFDTQVARVFGEVRADLESRGLLLPDADIQIAATAIFHDLVLVTGNLQHFKRIPALALSLVFADARAAGRNPDKS